MKKTKMVLAYIVIFMLGITADYARPPEKPIPEKILDSVVLVNTSSGVVVYSDDSRSLVLTAKHVVMNDESVEISRITITKNNAIVFEQHTSTKIELSGNHDLALVEITEKLPRSKIAKKIPSIGDDLWIASNPNKNYRSLKKGILSSHKRLIRERAPEYYWEVSGTIAPGSSGGGIFDESGRLVAVISGVDTLDTGQCFLAIKPDGPRVICLRLPLTGIGYVVPLGVVQDFLLGSSFSKYFK